MAELIVLVEGYVKDNGHTMQATVTLVRDNNHTIIVDPGVTYDPRTITHALQTHGLQPDDIDTVFITHHHPSHTRYMGLFLGARVYDYASVYASDQQWQGGDGHAITPHVTIMHTPGHTNEDAALIVTHVTNIPGKTPCTVAICHLWRFEGKDDDPTADNTKKLRESRMKVSALADYIVPAHGNIFPVH